MFTNTFRTIVSGTVELIWPRRCWLCDVECTSSLCDSCQTDLTSDTSLTCPRCSSTVGPYSDLSDGCDQCRKHNYHFDAAYRLGIYDGRLREAVLRIKHESGEALAEELGRVLPRLRSAGLNAHQLDAVVPVALHWLRRWSRGYNQSETLARTIADSLRLPFHNWLMRIRPTPSQRAQTATARWENVRGAFRVRRGAPVQGKRILLVDDVLTTGATADAAALALRQAGAAQVVMAVLARR